MTEREPYEEEGIGIIHAGRSGWDGDRPLRLAVAMAFVVAGLCLSISAAATWEASNMWAPLRGSYSIRDKMAFPRVGLCHVPADASVTCTDPHGSACDVALVNVTNNRAEQNTSMGALGHGPFALCW